MSLHAIYRSDIDDYACRTTRSSGATWAKRGRRRVERDYRRSAPSTLAVPFAVCGLGATPAPGASSSTIDACAAIAMQRGAFAKLATEAEDGLRSTADGEPPRLRFAAEHEGFNLHAGVPIAAGDDLGRERLCRYGARPALALDRLRRLPDGRVAYRVKYTRAGAAKHRVMTPLEFLARLSAIIPPPRDRTAPVRSDPHAGQTGTRTPPRTPSRTRPTGDTPDRVPDDAEASATKASTTRSSPLGASDVIRLAPNVLAVRQWQRLHDGALLAITRTSTGRRS